MKAYFLLIFSVLISFFSLSQETHYVLVSDMSYLPNNITIEVGDQVSFTHEGVGVHDVNFTINSLTSEPFANPVEIATLPAGGEFQSEAGLMGIINFDVPGTYNYDCSMYGHASMGMVGSITVNEQICEDDDSFVNDNFGSFFISDCPALISFLADSYNYSTFESCSWNGSPMNDFGGLLISDICECSCEGVEEETNTIVDIIVGSEDHNSLETALMVAGLVETLNSDGPWTVFAPTDAAFEALPEGLLDDLLANTESLTSILSHHVVSGIGMSTDLYEDYDGLTVPTLNDTEILVTIDENAIMIDNALIITADLVADNGVVHIIDTVLLPEGGCVDDDSIIDDAFQTLSTCSETISFLMTNYSYSEYDACAWNGDMGSGSLFSGMNLFEFCECSCADVANSVFVNEHSFYNKEIKIIVDVLGREVINPIINVPYFIIYKDGSYLKSMILNR